MAWLLRRAPSLLVVLLVLGAVGVSAGPGPVGWLGPERALAADPLPVSVYLPSVAAGRQPLPVLVALHGMGGDGPTFAAPLISLAERNGWILVAPTFGFGDWRDPEQVRQDDVYFLPALKAALDGLPARTGLQVRPRALIYGHSRGCQLAHRFAEFYPQAVLGVAGFSCGTYTLPYTSASSLPGGQTLPLNFPYGLSDLPRYTGRALDLESLRRVGFLIGVGARDNQAADVPRQWDPYLGANRVDRAWAYYRALDSLGVRARVVVFSDTAHNESDEMRTQAVAYLASLIIPSGPGSAF